MSNPDVTRHLQAMFDANNAAFAEIRTANEAMRDAGALIVDAHAKMQAAFDAHDALIVAAMKANQAAIAILHAPNPDV
jgi:hypothetical protein